MAPDQKRRRLSDDGSYSIAEVDTIEAPEEDPDAPRGHRKADLDLRRQLFVRSLPATATTESLIAHFSQTYPIKHAVAVIDRKSNQCKGYGFITFADSEDAQRAKEEFDGSIFEGRKINVEVAKPRRRETTAATEEPGDIPHSTPKKSKEEVSKNERPQPPRLIIRNLPWSIKEPEQLEHLFRSYGKIKQAILPKTGPGRLAGFGFVMIRGRKNAEKAIAGVNGKEIDGRVLAVDWAVQKSVWEKAKQQDQEPEGGNGEDGSVETISKEKESVDVNMDDVLDSDAENGTNSSTTSEEVDEDEDEDEVEDEDEDEPAPPTPEKENNYRTHTMFIRNLPFTATDDSLYEHFKQFGPVRYAKIVMDHSTERPKGTGFVCFYSEEDGISCLRGAPKQNDPKTRTESKSASKPSVLEDELLDPSGRYTMEGRVLHIARAVDKNEANRLTEEGDAHRFERDKDKRRLYLLSEGTIPEGSELYNKLSPSESKMREASATQRTTLVKNNPSLSLSLTRLSIRNIPRSITSKELKALAREAIVGFAKDVKEGLRQPLSKEELHRGGEEMREAERLRKQKGKGVVKQAKVVFESKEGTKISEDAGAGRSRGYGFIEYYTHRLALMGLRWLNGHAVTSHSTDPKKHKNPGQDQTGKTKRLIVEFAIENAQVVARRQEKETKAREKRRNPNNKKEKDSVPTTESRSSGESAAKDQSKKGTKRKREGSRSAHHAGTEIPTGKQSAKDGDDVESKKLATERRIIANKRMKKRRQASAVKHS